MAGPVSKIKNADLIERAAEKDMITIKFNEGTIREFKVFSKGKNYLDCAELKAGKETEKQFRIKVYPNHNQVGATPLVDGNPTSFKYGQLDAVELKHEAEPEKPQQPAPKPKAKPKADEPKAEKKQEPKATKATVPAKYSDEDRENDAARVSTYFQKLVESGKITGEKARLLYGPGNKFNLIEELKGMEGAIEWLTSKKAEGAEKSNAELAAEQLTVIIAEQKWGAGVKGFGKFKEWVQSQLAPSSEAGKTDKAPPAPAEPASAQTDLAPKSMAAKSQAAETIPFGELVGKPYASTSELLRILANQPKGQAKFLSGSLNKPVYEKDGALYTVEMGKKGLTATKIEMKASVPKPVEERRDMLMPPSVPVVAAPVPSTAQVQPIEQAAQTQATLPKSQRDEIVGMFLENPASYLGSEKPLELLNPKLTLETILADRKKEGKNEDFADQTELDIFLRRYVKESK